VTVDQVVDMIAMGDRFMATARAMNMFCIVSAANMTTGTLRWVEVGYCKRVLLDHPVLLMMKMPFV